MRALFIKGNEALQRDNADYAIALFTQVLQKEPALYDCRKALRVAQQQKAAQAGRGFFKKMFSSASASPQLLKAQATLRGNPTEAMHTAEQVLNQDPNNNLAHKVFAEAAVAAACRAARCSPLKCSNSTRRRTSGWASSSPRRWRRGRGGPGEQVLVELARAFPNDNELSQELKNLSARKTLDEGGYEALADGKGSYRDILKDKEQAAALEQEQRIQKTEDVAARLIGEYEARLPNEPNNLKLLRSLAELYTQKKDFDRALQYYDRIRATDVGGSDPSLDRAIAETVARRFDQALAALDPEAPGLRRTIRQARRREKAFQLSECQKRVERFPTDLGIRFELGQLLFEAGRIWRGHRRVPKSPEQPA